MSVTGTRRGVLKAFGGLVAAAILVPELDALLTSRQALNTTTLRHFPALGTRVSFLVRHPDSRLAEEAVRLAIREVFAVHDAMTLHGPSPLTWLNSSPVDRAVEVPESFLEVLEASRKIHRATGGLFDATLGGTPGWEAVRVDEANRSVALAHPDANLDFNGIAKGYAVDRAAGALRREGLGNFLINAGGDLYAAGTPGDGASGWTVRLDVPESSPVAARRILVKDLAVATSGNWMRPKGPDGRVAPHLHHPRLDDAADEIVSATALAPTAMAADAWATAAFVGGPSEITTLAQAPELDLHFLGHREWLTGSRGRG